MRVTVGMHSFLPGATVTCWIAHQPFVMVLMQRDTDGTQLHVPDSPSSSRSMIPVGTEPDEVAAYCQVRNIWTILGGDLNQPGAKQATKVHSMVETCVQRCPSDACTCKTLSGHLDYSGRGSE